MSTVFAGERPLVLDEWLARRRELGQDRFDEVWEGNYHVAPGPSFAHGAIGSQVTGALLPRAEAAGLQVTTAFNIGNPHDYRVPDGGVHRERTGGVFVDTAAMVIEIISPGDETMAKFGFYARHGVSEVLVADPGSRTVRIWALREDGNYDETGRSDLLAVDAATLTAELDWP